MGGASALLELSDDGVPLKMRSKTIRDPIHGYIRTTTIERRIIDDPIFQRLKRLHQLQTAYHVYPGAEHSRFQHCVGVMHLAGKFIISVLKRTYELAGKEKDNMRIPYVEELGIESKEELITMSLAVRIGGLLHDIGHGPYSHAFDEAVVSKIESLKKIGVYSHEDIGYFMFKNYISEIIRKEADKAEVNINSDLLLEFLDAILSPREKFRNDSKFISLRQKMPIIDIMRQTIREFMYPSDILDFVMRDSYFTGVREYGMVDVDRLLNYSVIFASSEGEFKPTLQIGLLDNSINAFRAFLMSRFWLFNNVYYHRTSRIMDFMVQRLLKVLYRDKIIDFEEAIHLAIQGDISKYRVLDDYSILYAGYHGNDKSRKLAESILDRKKAYVEVFDKEFIISGNIHQKYRSIESFDNILAKIREIVKELLREYGINAGEESVKVDSPKIRFFPDNPYLPRRSFNIVKVRRDKLIDILQMTVADIGIAINTSPFRIFILKEHEDLLRDRGIEIDILRNKVAKILEEKDLIEKAKYAFWQEMEKSGEEIGVTM